jgi:repressor LexA
MLQFLNIYDILLFRKEVSNMKISNTAQRLKEAMDLRNLKQSEIIEKTGMNKGALSSYLSGRYEPKQDNIYLLSSILNVNEAWLMGYDVPMEKNTNSDINIFKYDNISPITTQKIPLLGEIACGEPIYAQEDYEAYIETDENINADFCLKCKGDSMIDFGIYNGSIVFIRSQPIVNDGEIAAIIIEDSATLKRVYYDKQKNLLTLRAGNPNMRDLIYSQDELTQIRIIGKAVKVLNNIK